MDLKVSCFSALSFFFALLAGFLPLSNPANAADYFVSSSGSDTDSGSISAPFKTIQKCATVVAAGESCFIRGGTYRETVIPSNSGSASNPITYTTYNNEFVTVNGADLVTGWSAYSGSIF